MASAKCAPSPPRRTPRSEPDSRHSEALAAGLRGMEEAESFMPRGSRLEAELDLDLLIASHRTTLLHDLVADPDRSHRPTPLQAQTRYLAYAQRQLANATAGLPIGAMALYGLGKVHATLASADAENRAVEEPRAMTFYQAALLADPDNPLAANELGVMLARAQRYEEARAVLQHSVAVVSMPEAWRNLARVHQALGETDLAQRAEQQAIQAQARLANGKAPSHPAMAHGAVRWMPPAQFAQMRTADTNPTPMPESKAASPPAKTSAPQAAVPTPPADNAASGSSAFGWLPWSTKK
ncbi:MAG: hypothetical protein K8T25_13125 [Planctomycetia bacterium]|nr:hypothetical protein [Planctomycetia bacterium]